MTKPRETVPAPQSAQKEDPRAKAAAIENAKAHKAAEKKAAKAAPEAPSKAPAEE